MAIIVDLYDFCFLTFSFFPLSLAAPLQHELGVCYVILHVYQCVCAIKQMYLKLKVSRKTKGHFNLMLQILTQNGAVWDFSM